MAVSANGSLSTITPSLSNMTNFQGEPLTCPTLPGRLKPVPRSPLHAAEREPYTFGMSTEDDLRHMGQAAAALVGVAAARAKQVAEQLLGNRDRGREEFKRRGDSFVEEGRHAAADVVGALRREASVILHDLEHLEQTLRAREGGAEAGGATTATSTGTTAVLTELEPTKRTPAKRSAAGPSGEKPAARATKTATAGKSAATKAAKANATKEAAPRAKAAGGRKAASPRKTTGGTNRPSSEGQG
jgi:hypothetical protein